MAFNRKKAALTTLNWKNSGVNDVEPKNTSFTALNWKNDGVNDVEPKKNGVNVVQPEKERR